MSVNFDNQSKGMTMKCDNRKHILVNNEALPQITDLCHKENMAAAGRNAVIQYDIYTEVFQALMEPSVSLPNTEA